MGEPSTEQDVIELLTTDHAEVEQMFRQIESLPEGDPRNRLIDGVIRALSVHAAIEEQVVYPAMRKALPDGETLVQMAIDEHQHIKDTLAAIEHAASTDKRDPLLLQLMSNLRHHVDEEETELFPKLRASLGRDELDAMGSKLEAARKVAPTRPHPHAPNTPPGNIVAGAAAAAIDRARDALRRD